MVINSATAELGTFGRILLLGVLGALALLGGLWASERFAAIPQWQFHHRHRDLALHADIVSAVTNDPSSLLRTP